MLLIGSRAIRHHFPDFRPPRDWDLVGTEEEIARLDRVLPRAKQARGPEKAHFRLGGALVEVANASVIAYWDRVLKLFENEPTLKEPTLGALHIAPAAYLLLTKQCGLIYRITHWHKNLEDLYFLRERIPIIPDSIAALLPDALADSRRMFGDSHQKRATEPYACYPDLPPSDEPALHEKLHSLLALGTSPVCREPGAWQGFSSFQKAERRRLMKTLFAEEAMVLAAEQYVKRNSQCPTEDEAELTRWALRTLIVSGLPEGLRYFGVNHYREIRNLILPGFIGRVAKLRRPAYSKICDGAVAICDAPAGDAAALCQS